MTRRDLLPVFLLLAVGCASTAPIVESDEPRRVVGTDNQVRIDAEVRGERLTQGMTLQFRYDLTNQRPEPIAVADIIPEVTYDEETQTVTVSLGSEVPGNELVPRLVAIAPGERKSFTSSARIRVPMARTTRSPYVRSPRALRFKVNFLSGELTPFAPLLELTAKGTHDPKLADALFPLWLERNEVVYTNSVPMRWGVVEEPADTRVQVGRRRR